MAQSRVGPDDAFSRADMSMTRRDRERPGASFTTLRHTPPVSAWTRDALYGGSLALAALVLALGFVIVRPTPRRRPPEVVAPAWARRGRPR
jgi:hypothetical protein